MCAALGVLRANDFNIYLKFPRCRIPDTDWSGHADKRSLECSRSDTLALL